MSKVTELGWSQSLNPGFLLYDLPLLKYSTCGLSRGRLHVVIVKKTVTKHISSVSVHIGLNMRIRNRINLLLNNTIKIKGRKTSYILQ